MSDSPVLPPGMCLTDIWDHLTPAQRRPWLRIVEREARQVREEVQRARRGLRPVGEAARRRQDDLAQAMSGYRVGHPRASRRPA